MTGATHPHCSGVNVTTKFPFERGGSDDTSSLTIGITEETLNSVQTGLTVHVCLFVAIRKQSKLLDVRWKPTEFCVGQILSPDSTPIPITEFRVTRRP
jgi:hypothetical protein